jgi:undecaprenyl pyrophosphate synthase
MNNQRSLSNIKFTKSVTGEDINLRMKLEYINLFRNTLENNPTRSKKEICQIAKISPDRLRRYMKDTNTPSFYRHTTSVKRYKKSKELDNSVNKSKNKLSYKNNDKLNRGGGKSYDISDNLSLEITTDNNHKIADSFKK